MVKHAVKINNIEVPFTNLEYRRSFELEAQKISVRLPILETFAQDQVIEILRDDATVIKGRLKSTKALVSEKEGVDLIAGGFDYKRKLLKLLTPDWVYNTAAPEDIVEAMLANTDLTKGTFSAYGENIGMIFGTDSLNKFSRVRAIEDICFVTGWEFYAAPDGTTDFKSACGTDRSATITFKRDENLIKWVEPYTEGYNHIINRAVVIGATIGDFMAYGIVESGYSSGDPEKEFKRKSLHTDDTCQKAATALIADHVNMVKYGTIEVIDFYDGHAYDVFDTVNVVDRILDIDVDLRIAEIRRIVNMRGEQTFLTLTNLTKINTNAPFILKPEEETLFRETLRATDAIQQTKQYPRFERYILLGESLDGYTITTDQDSSILAGKNYVEMKCGTVANFGCQLESPVNVNLEKNPRFKARIKKTYNNRSFTTIDLIDAATPTNGFGFLFDQNGDVYVRWTRGSTGYSQQIGTYIANTIYTIETVYEFEKQLKFYLDGTLTTITANLPLTDMVQSAFASNSNQSSGNNDSLFIYYFATVEMW